MPKSREFANATLKLAVNGIVIQIVSQMKTATVRELRNEFGKISEWLERGEAVEIMKRGKAFARIEPARRHQTFVGACPLSSKLPRDLDEPVNAKWDAAQ